MTPFPRRDPSAPAKPPKRWSYAVTFERPLTHPPETVRGTVVGNSPSSAVSVAVREARRAKPGQRFDSLVILLERERVIQ